MTIAIIAAMPVLAGEGTTGTSPAAEAVSLALTDGRSVTGALISMDDREVVLRVNRRIQKIPLEQVKPVSVYLARKRLVDLTKAPVRMELGRYLLEHGELSLAQREFSEALGIDPGLSAQVRELLKTAKTAEKSPAASQPAPKTAPQAAKTEKYARAAPAEIAANQKRAKDMAEQAKSFAPALRLVETKHFLIFSSWPPAQNGALAELCEKMYRTCCAQFDIRETENVFAGKCPVFLFCQKDQFERFAADVDRAGTTQAAGYVKFSAGSYCHIVINAIHTYDRFCEVLVHEGSHAFMSRYLSSRILPQWLNEGLADYLAATVLPRSAAAQRHRKAARQALRENIDVTYIFRRLSVDDFDYGIAQSIVCFMIETNRRGFVKFVTLIKEGKSENEALKESFDCTHQQLLERWHAGATRAYSR